MVAVRKFSTAVFFVAVTDDEFKPSMCSVVHRYIVYVPIHSYMYKYTDIQIKCNIICK